MFCVGVCMRTELCGVRRPPVRPCAPLGTMCTGYLRRVVPVSSVWLRAHLVWLRGQGVAACGRMYDGRRVKRKFAVWRYRVWGYRAVLWNFVSRMWKSCSRQAVSKSVNIKNRSNLGICCLGNCVRCGFHKFMENGFAWGITADREVACGRNHRSIFGATHGGFSEEEHSGWQN